MTNPDQNNDDYQPSLDELIPLRKAAEMSGLTQGHISLLIRKGELWGTKMGGRNWFTTEKAVRDYLATNPRTGPK